MPDYAKLCIPAAQFGLVVLLFMHLVDSSGLRYNNAFSKILIAALFAATFPTRFHDPIKVHVMRYSRNTAIAILFLAMSIGAAVSVLLVTEEVIPRVGRYLRDVKWPSVWAVDFILFVIAVNLDWPAIWQGLRAKMGFEQQDTETT